MLHLSYTDFKDFGLTLLCSILFGAELLQVAYSVPGGIITAMWNYIKDHFTIGLIYLLLCLVIGECHPFTLVSMYNFFPRQSTVFYVANSNGVPMALTQYFDYKTDDLNHNFYALCEQRKVNTNHPSVEEYNRVGKEMFSMLSVHKKQSIISDSIQLHRIDYVFQSDSILKTDKVIYVGSTD